MEKKYKVKVNDSLEYEFFLKRKFRHLDSQKISASQYHLLQNNRSFKAEILAGKIFKERVCGKDQ
jgi:hypothetical protein